LSFACGHRALARHRLLRDSAAASLRLLSTGPSEIPGAIEKLQSELRDMRRARQQLEGELAALRARSLVERSITRGEIRIVAEVVEGDANAIKLLASAIAGSPGYVVGLVSSSSPHSVVIAVSPGSPFSAREAVAKLTELLGGRGGGRVDLAQAGGLSGPVELILDTLRGFWT
jgi:alanyl-tRNA synthetase